MNGQEKHTEKNKEEEDQAKNKVPFLKLFSFADFYDYVLMAIGSLGACAHGASVPVFFIFFGKLINIIGIAYLFPASVSHEVAKVTISKLFPTFFLFNCPSQRVCAMLQKTAFVDYLFFPGENLLQLHQK